VLSLTVSAKCAQFHKENVRETLFPADRECFRRIGRVARRAAGGAAARHKL
jgi:hypothetical protein